MMDLGGEIYVTSYNCRCWFSKLLVADANSNLATTKVPHCVHCAVHQDTLHVDPVHDIRAKKKRFQLLASYCIL